MPRKQDVGIGQNPELLSLLHAGASVSFGARVMYMERDTLGGYIVARASDRSEFFSQCEEGVIGAILFLEIPIPDDGFPFIIEDNPSLFQILIYGGSVHFNGRKMWAEGRKLFVNHVCIGELSLVNQGVALRIIGLAPMMLRQRVIDSIQTSLREKQVTITLNGNAGRQDILGIVAAIYQVVSGGDDG